MATQTPLTIEWLDNFRFDHPETCDDKRHMFEFALGSYGCTFLTIDLCRTQDNKAYEWYTEEFIGLCRAIGLIAYEYDPE